MKFENLIYNKILYCIITLIVFVVVTFIVKCYLKLFFVIIITVIICSPVQNVLNKSKIFNAKVNALICIILMNCILLMLLFLAGNFIYKELHTFIGNLIIVFNNMQDSLLSIDKSAGFNLSKLCNNLLYNSRGVMNSGIITKGALYTTDGIFDYFVGTMIAYFILADNYDIVNCGNYIIPKDKMSIVYAKLKDISRVIKLEGMLVFITTIETIIGFRILSIDYFILLGILCGILDMLPYVGTIMVFLPLVIYKVLIGQYIIAFGVICLYLFLIISRQIVEAKFISSSLQLHPLLIIISLYIGIKIFGIVGLFMAPIYVITAKEIIQY
ncbi:AI-2E family transporter [Clostridium sp. DJ247]|uniref:AI-2E family transporter n=1 Tax=Clostridium sp. DJ247 TaxID=2726188 RepID=UPI001629E642|nr:AI-2E family transporter [Clostridium sp. DJ247]MBC2578921.1 AI-2E family transporter [Clostridium sp. DJ247]